MDLKERVDALERIVWELEAKEKIRDTITKYCVGLDTEDRDMLKSIFTKDAVFESSWREKTYTGDEVIADFFMDQRKYLLRAQRISVNERITVNGTTATAVSDCWVKYSVGNESYIGGGTGTYEWWFRLEDGDWKISHFHIILKWMTTLKRGWGMDVDPMMPRPFTSPKYP